MMQFNLYEVIFDTFERKIAFVGIIGITFIGKHFFFFMKVKQEYFRLQEFRHSEQSYTYFDPSYSEIKKYQLK